MEASRRAAMRALELDDELAEAWLSLAEIQFDYDWDWSRAEVSIRTALEYGPQNAPVLRQPPGLHFRWEKWSERWAWLSLLLIWTRLTIRV